MGTNGFTGFKCVQSHKERKQTEIPSFNLFKVTMKVLHQKKNYVILVTLTTSLMAPFTLVRTV